MSRTPSPPPRTAPYRKPVSTFWWLQRPSYLLFVLRELSAVFVAWFVVFLLLLVEAIGEGGAEYERFQDWSANWWVVLLNAIGLLFVLLHAVTWFNVAPRAIVLHVRGRRVRPGPVLAAHYVLWALLSAAVAWLILGG
ncbi:hypothetical protein [Streptomyces sp. KR80]|uniref:hypothetical protein n=1 Tax=Streptomyces sp. KR80 TaxID=3457426 RepID=UPI003FD4E306